MEKTSIGVGRAALHVAISESRAEEMALRKAFEAQGIAGRQRGRLLRRAEYEATVGACWHLGRER